MNNYKKIILYSISGLFVLLTTIELIKYLISDSNIFGLVYLLSSMLIVFLLVPASYNYNNRYSLARLSKLLIAVVIGFFLSYILNIVLLNSLKYIDSSKEFINSIHLIKNVIKPILYSLLLLFIIVDSDLIIKIKNSTLLKK